MRALATLIGSLFLAACGAGENEVAADRAPARTATPAAKRTPASSFPSRPQIKEPGTFRLSREARTVDTPAALRGTMTETTVRGAGGPACRLSDSGRSGYALVMDGPARVLVLRREDGRTRVLSTIRLAPNERSTPALLRLGCGESPAGSPITLAFTVNASPYAFVADERALPAGRPGVLATGRARFDGLAVWLAD